MYTQAHYSRLFWWLLAGYAAVNLLWLGAAPVYILDEAKNAQCAREMWEAGDWVVPTFNGELRTDKPALHYWFMQLSYSLFGVGPWQARFFSAIMGIGTVFISFWFVRRLANAGWAFFTALVLALSTHFVFEFRLAVPDPYLIFFTTLGLFAGYTYLQERKMGWLLLAAAALALATLAKGPVALGLPGLCLLVLVVWQRHWFVFTDWRLLLAALLYAAVAAPWYWLVHQATDGAFTRGFFLEHNIGRFSAEMEGHGGPFIITPVIVLVGMLPFSTLVWLLVQQLRRQRLASLLQLGLVVTLVYIVFFSVSSTKLPNYPMPCYAFVALLLGWALQQLLDGGRRWPAYVWWLQVVLGLLLSIGAYVALVQTKDVAPWRWLAFGMLSWPLATAMAWWVSGRQGLRPALAWLAAGWLLFNAYFVAVAYPQLYRQNPVTLSAAIWQAPGTRLLAYKQFNPAFLFNHPVPGQRVQVYTDTAELRQALLAEKDRPTVLITRSEHLPDLQGLPCQPRFSRQDLFELPTTVLLLSKPAR